MHVADGLPVPEVATPTLGVESLCLAVDLLAMRQDVGVVPGVALRRGDKLDRAVQVFVVVPIDKSAHPGACTVQCREHFLGIFRPILQRTKQRLRIGIVVAHQWATERWYDTQQVQRGQQSRTLHRCCHCLNATSRYPGARFLGDR